MAQAFEDVRSKRRRLAAELLRLRDQAGLSGRALAQRIGISQSKISRIEAGTTMPSMPEVTAWAKAVDADDATRDSLRTLTEAAYVEIHGWRELLRDRPHLQDEIGHREAAAERVRTFQPSIVPGLLQTGDYAAQVFSMFQVPYAKADLAAAVAGRLERQAALRGGGAFDFLVTEAALRWRPGPRSLLVAQFERIVQLSTIDTVSVAVIPTDVTAVAAVPHGFVIYEHHGFAYATVETIHANVEVTEPADVGLYYDQWIELGRMALHDDDARRFVAVLANEFLRGTA
jgi:transcriptional regulator with XRE-family HTH domain